MQHLLLGRQKATPTPLYCTSTTTARIRRCIDWIIFTPNQTQIGLVWTREVAVEHIISYHIRMHLPSDTSDTSNSSIIGGVGIIIQLQTSPSTSPSTTMIVLPLLLLLSLLLLLPQLVSIRAIQQRYHSSSTVAGIISISTSSNFYQ